VRRVTALEQVVGQIREHPWRSYLASGLALFGLVTGLNQLFGLQWQYGLFIMVVHLAGYLASYAGIVFSQERIRYFSSQTEAGQAIFQTVQAAKRSVKLISFTSETLYNLLSQTLIERLLDQGIESEWLMATPESRYYLRDDTREKYERSFELILRDG